MKRPVLSLIFGVIVVIAALGLLIQAVPYGHNHTNPPVTSEPTWDSPQTRALAVQSCYDCHSNQTTWYWYTNIAPFSWLVQHDVDEGRRRLNFSEWGSRPGRGSEEIARVINNGSMPPIQYTIIHPNAILSSDQKLQLIQGLQNSLK